MWFLMKYKMTLCLYNKWKNTGDMTGIVHTFCKYIRSWFYNLLDMVSFRTFLIACNQVFLQYQANNLNDIIRM